MTTFDTSGLAASDPAASDTAAPAASTGQRAASAQSLDIGGVDVHLDFLDTAFRHGTDPIVDWIERSIEIVAGYYGRFPQTQLRIRVALSDGGGVRGGTAYGTAAPLIRLRVGRDVTAAELRDDWVLVHEMAHLALPDVGRTHAWFSEGLATYVEGIARAQARQRAPADVWAEYVQGMPRGLPQGGDQGLDHTHTWGRTYWGGALFCLLADVEIRSRTDNRLGLQDALRAVLQSSRGLVSDWPITRILMTGDAAVGATVLQDLYSEMKDTPVTPDLAALWKRLGVERNGVAVDLRDDAPLTNIREAIMRRPAR
ncbi:MAG: hypothetical protein AB7N70_34315 [Dehalococcoidia bacterium]